MFSLGLRSLAYVLVACNLASELLHIFYRQEDIITFCSGRLVNKLLVKKCPSYFTENHTVRHSFCTFDGSIFDFL